jgi:ABC-type multidrug transport system fused ATPase/permease subunit
MNCQYPLRGHHFAITGATVCVITLFLSWGLVMVLPGHGKPNQLPVLSETGIDPPERYLFTSGLCIGALCFSISSVFLYTYIQARMNHIFLSSQNRPSSSVVGCGSCQYSRWLPLLNKAAVVVAQLSSFCLAFLAVVDLGGAKVPHLIAAFFFFMFSLFQGFLLCVTFYIMLYRIRENVISSHERLWFIGKVVSWIICFGCWIVLPMAEGLIIAIVHGQTPSKDTLHNISALNQYSVVITLMFHAFFYTFELSRVTLLPEFVVTLHELDGVMTDDVAYYHVDRKKQQGEENVSYSKDLEQAAEGDEENKEETLS